MTPIPTVFTNQQELLAAVAALHGDGAPYHADLFYGNGSFWTGPALPFKPSIRMDLTPVWKPSKTDPTAESTEVNLQADARSLPFQNASLRSIVSDPPFIHAAGAESIMGKRFGSYPSQLALRQMYWKALMEMQRCLVPGGLLIWKTQDIIESGKQNWTHTEIMSNARTCGIPVIDIFILVRKATIMGHNHHERQLHARKNHSYAIVCRKGGDRKP